MKAVPLPRFNPMPLAFLREPFDHPDWLFEPKLDGFRALAYIEGGRCKLVSRRGNAYEAFPALCAAIGAAIPGAAVLDGEIVHLGDDGKPRFYDLMRRRAPQHFYAFDLVWQDGRDLRQLPLPERKRMLRAVVRPPVLYVEHFASGVELFSAVCRQDMEGIVAKFASAPYTPEATTWGKIKNGAYSQAEGRAEFFESRRSLMPG